MAEPLLKPRTVKSIASVLTVARLKETRRLQALQRSEARLLEQQKLLATLFEYGAEYRKKIADMDRAGNRLGAASLLQRQNLLAMMNQVEKMKVAQNAQVRHAEADRLRMRQAFYQAHVYAENVQTLYEQKKYTLQEQKNRRAEKTSADEYLTRFALSTPIASA